MFIILIENKCFRLSVNGIHLSIWRVYKTIYLYVYHTYNIRLNLCPPGNLVRHLEGGTTHVRVRCTTTLGEDQWTPGCRGIQTVRSGQENIRVGQRQGLERLKGWSEWVHYYHNLIKRCMSVSPWPKFTSIHFFQWI